jgi:hypothetical protein
MTISDQDKLSALTPVKVIKLFCRLLMLQKNKLEHLSFWQFFQSCPILVSKARGMPKDCIFSFSKLVDCSPSHTTNRLAFHIKTLWLNYIPPAVRVYKVNTCMDWFFAGSEGWSWTNWDEFGGKVDIMKTSSQLVMMISNLELLKTATPCGKFNYHLFTHGTGNYAPTVAA